MLSGDSSSEGLIANNSSTVIPEVGDLDIFNLFYNHSYDCGSKYVGAKMLIDILDLVSWLNDVQMFITTTQDTEAQPFFQNYACNLNIRIKIPKNTNFYLDKALKKRKIEE